MHKGHGGKVSAIMLRIYVLARKQRLRFKHKVLLEL
jgi:hypothetical protein